MGWGRPAEEVVLLCFQLSIAGGPVLSAGSAPTELSRWSGSDCLSFHLRWGSGGESLCLPEMTHPPDPRTSAAAQSSKDPNMCRTPLFSFFLPFFFNNLLTTSCSLSPGRMQGSRCCPLYCLSNVASWRVTSRTCQDGSGRLQSQHSRSFRD